MKRLQVLLVAHHANPEWGSEPLIGWRWASHLPKHVDVTLLTHVRNREALERADTGSLRIRYVDTEKTARRVEKWNDALWGKGAPVNRLFLEWFAQRAFDREACRIARELMKDNHFDLVHRVSPISPRFPTKLGQLGVPLLIGPVNGGMQTAPGFQGVRARERDWVLALRGLSRLVDPRGRAYRDALGVLSATQATRAVLPRSVQAKTVDFCENGVELEDYDPVFERQGEGLRLLYLGRLLPYKGVEWILRALHRIEDPAVTLDVVGQGPDEQRLRTLTADLGLEERVRFLGAVPVGEVPKRMQACDVYVFPSVRESGGSTVLEAMAAGKPVLVADHGGPSETVLDGTGFRLRCDTPELLVDELIDRVEWMRDHELMRERMGRQARLHVAATYAWSEKAKAMVGLYRKCLEGRRSKARHLTDNVSNWSRLRTVGMQKEPI